MTAALKRSAPWLLAAACLALAVMLLFRECGPLPVGTVTVIRDTIPGDPYPVEVPRYVPKITYVDTGRTVYVPGMPVPTDTAAIVRDYLSVRFYADTLKNDTSMLAVVEDSVSANRIVSRRFTYQNRRPTAINTTIIQPPRKEPALRLYAGAFAGYSPRSLRFAAGPELTFALRGGFIGRYGYDVAGNGHQVSAGWKVSFKRK